MIRTKNNTRLDLSTEKIFNLLLYPVVVASFYLMYFDAYWLKWIPVSTESLFPIASVGYVKGEVTRRLRNDTLHLPLTALATVFEDDIIRTNEESSVQLFFDPKNFIVVEPNAIMRVRALDGVPILHLMAGGVSTHFTQDKTIKVQYGNKLDEVQIRKGSYFVNNLSAGLQVTTFTTKNLVKEGISDQSNAKMRAAEVEDQTGDTESKDQIIAENVEALGNGKEREPSAEKAFPLKLPYPPKNSMLLYNQDVVVVIAAKTNCEGPCELRVSVNQKKVYSKKFADGEFAKFELEVKDGTKAEVHWSFQDLEMTYEDDFVVDKYTEEHFSQALEQGMTVEML